MDSPFIFTYLFLLSTCLHPRCLLPNRHIKLYAGLNNLHEYFLHLVVWACTDSFYLCNHDIYLISFQLYIFNLPVNRFNTVSF